MEYLGPEFIARSQEYIVNIRSSAGELYYFMRPAGNVEGGILDPWSLWDQNSFNSYFSTKFRQENINQKSRATGFKSVENFVQKVRGMIFNAGYIPDLAGNGNILITAKGEIKLVDINNIIRIEENDTISLDDKLYPSCDKSIEIYFPSSKIKSSKPKFY